MKRSVVSVVAPLAVAIGLWGASAMAQQGQPGQGQPGQGQPGQVQGLPAGHPRLDLPPQGRPPGPPGQGFGQPGGRPGFPPGGFQQPRPLTPPPAHVEHAEEHAGGHGGHCPGHGPHDVPHFDKINWWRGMIGVNNEKAVSPSALDQLLWRYDNHSDPCDEKNTPPPFLAQILNLGILAYIIYRFGKKPITEALAKRKQTIMSDIDTASSLKAAAEARLDEYESKLERLEDKLEEVKAEYAAQAEREKKHIIAEAEERRQRMIRDAEFRVEQELRAARLELMQQAVLDATAAAEEIIRKRAAQADLDRMSEEYLGSVRTALTSASLQGGK